MSVYTSEGSTELDSQIGTVKNSLIPSKTASDKSQRQNGMPIIYFLIVLF